LGNIKVFKAYDEKKIMKALHKDDYIKCYSDDNIVVIASVWETYREIYKTVRRYTIPGGITQNILMNMIG
jgi:hypothetical protein